MSKLNFIKFGVICLALAIPSVYFLPASVAAVSSGPAQEAEADQGNIGKTFAQIQTDLGKPSGADDCQVNLVEGKTTQVFPGKALIYFHKDEDTTVIDALCFVRGTVVSERMVLKERVAGRVSRIEVETVDYTLLQAVMNSPSPKTSDRIIAPSADDLDI